MIRPASLKGLKQVFSERPEVADLGPGEVKAIKGVTTRLTVVVKPTAPTVHMAEGEFTSIALKGVRVGVTRVTLVDLDGKVETVVAGVVPKK